MDTSAGQAREHPTREATDTNDHPALEADGLGKRYRGPVQALQGVTLRVAKRGITAVVGPNGAGKSTLIRCWAGFERPSRGLVRVCGVDPWRRRSEALARTGYVPQSPALYDTLSVDEHLGMADQLRPGFDRTFAATRLVRLGIRPTARGHELSGGQQAQVALTLALGTRAEVLLLDEPLADLDPLARREFLQLVVEAAAEHGTTVLLSSHIVTDIEQACDGLIVLGSGRVLAHAAIADLITSHAVSLTHPTGGDVVASFAGPDGRPRWLLRGPSAPGHEAATLEEVVVGYLASAKAAGAASVEPAA
jgi:ABC-2 type transport system ATP-binding protein